MNTRTSFARQRRDGFTLVELLVVIAIIGVFVALMTPALAHCRAAARRMQCSQNLMQLALATQQYETTHARFPLGCQSESGPILNRAEGLHQGWLIAVLPELDRRDVHGAFHPEASVYAEANASLRAIRVSQLVCPVDTSGRGRAAPISSYAGVTDVEETPISENGKGLFLLNKALRWDDVQDGLAHTIIIGEKISDQSDLGWTSGTRATLRHTGSPLNASQAILDDEQFVGGFSSWHGPGAQFALGDGQTRFLRNEIAPELLRSLGHRADGKPTTDEGY